MGAINRVFLMGNLTRDPAVRQTPGGLAVSDLGLAVSEQYRNKEGQLVKRVCFADIVVWGRQAENCGQYLSKGSPVMVEGSLQLDQWQTETGEKRSRLKVRADRVQFLGRIQGASTVPGGVSRPDTDQAPVPVTEPAGAAGDSMPF